MKPLRQISLAANQQNIVNKGKVESKFVSMCMKSATKQVQVKSLQQFKSGKSYTYN